MSKTTDKVVDTMNEGNEKPKQTRKPRTRKAKPKGLGDVVENITEATGIKKVVEAVAGDDCGCKERKLKLNQLFPLLSNLGMSDEQKIVWEQVILPEYKQGRLRSAAGAAAKKLHEDLGLGVVRWAGCPNCAKRALQKLENVYEASCAES
jgi:hypothetical protein